MDYVILNDGTRVPMKKRKDCIKRLDSITSVRS